MFQSNKIQKPDYMKASSVFAEIHNKFGALILENVNLVSQAIVNKSFFFLISHQNIFRIMLVFCSIQLACYCSKLARTLRVAEAIEACPTKYI